VGFDEQRLFWLTNPNPFPPMPGWIKFEDPFEPISGFNRRIMILGMKGHGKSYLGNWMLGNGPVAWPYSPEGREKEISLDHSLKAVAVYV
jgi:hypothetical protein